MALATIKKFSLLAHDSCRKELVEALHGWGVVQIVNLRERLTGNEKHYFTEIATEGEEFDEKLRQVEYCLQFLASFAPVKQKMMEQGNGKIVLSQEKFEELVGKSNLEETYECCRQLAARISELESRAGALASAYREICPWRDLTVSPRKWKELVRVKIVPGEMPCNRVAGLMEALGNLTKEAHLEIHKSTKTTAFCLLVYYPEWEEQVNGLLSNFDFKQITFPFDDLKPAEFLENLRNEQREITQKKQNYREEGEKLLEQAPPLMALHDYLLSIREQHAVQDYFARTEHAFLLEGWVRESDLEKLRAKLQSQFPATELTISEPEQGEEAPVELRNKSLVQPFQLITEMYGLPQRWEVDPSPFLAIFFTLFFGLCLTDAGYGLVIALLGWYALKKLQINQAGKQLLRFITSLGVGAIVVGIFTGGVFGIDFSLLPERFESISRVVGNLAILDPVNRDSFFIAFSLIIGIIHVWCGFAIKFYANIRNGNHAAAVFDQLSWMMIIPGVVCLYVMGEGYIDDRYLKVAQSVSLTGAGLVVLFHGRSVRNLLGRLAMGLYGLYGVMGIMGDILSYFRLFALGLATAILASVVNTFAVEALAIPYLGILFMLIVLVVGHGAIIFLNALGGAIHTMRLQFVEFFSKFYEGGGVPFEPFAQKNRFVVVQQESEEGG